MRGLACCVTSRGRSARTRFAMQSNAGQRGGVGACASNADDWGHNHIGQVTSQREHARAQRSIRVAEQRRRPPSGRCRGIVGEHRPTQVLVKGCARRAPRLERPSRPSTPGGGLPARCAVGARSGPLGTPPMREERRRRRYRRAGCRSRVATRTRSRSRTQPAT